MTTTLPDLLERTVALGGSDLHLTTGTPPRVRVDGLLRPLDLPVLTAAEMKPLACSMLTTVQGARFDEIGELDCAFGLGALGRFRCNLFTQRGSVAAVYRVIPERIRTCADLGVPAVVEAFARRPHGLVLVTGPTGSGKSTTIAALIDLINTERHGHILTIEDPIEFIHPHKHCIVNQREVHSDTGSFANALRGALREDPDVVLIGEMRDLETVSIAIETAETGHLVFGTLHTTTAASTVDRIIDQFPADRQSQVRVMLSESLRGVIAQTLCKKIGGGRVAAREVLLTIPAVSNLIREGKTFQIPSIMQTNRKAGMVTLNDALIELVDGKMVEAKEAYMKAVEKAGMLAALKAKRHDMSFLGE
jgi:twitching motility protein PilT